MINFRDIDFEYQRKQFYNTRSLDTKSHSLTQVIHMYIADTCKLNLQTLYNPFSGYDDERENWEDFICHFNMYVQDKDWSKGVTKMDCFTRPPMVSQELYGTTDYWWYVFQAARSVEGLVFGSDICGIEEYAQRYFENYRPPTFKV